MIEKTIQTLTDKTNKIDKSNPKSKGWWKLRKNSNFNKGSIIKYPSSLLSQITK